MGKIKASYVTDKGKQMLFSGSTVNYTKAVLYSQDVSNLTVSDLRQLTSLTGELMTTPIGVSDKQNGATSSVNVEVTFTNAGLDHDITFGSVGWFAKQGDNGTETLMAVQVANNGANLAAGSPNGATDAVDLTLSFAIGDATTVTAVIDPAGSVTPTELHNAITDVKSEMNTALDTKADKSAVDSDVKSINDTLATKADKRTVTDDLAKKADKTEVDAQIGTVNKSVSDLSDTVKANKDDTDKVLATKADKATVESELSTKANQSDLDKTNAEVAKKANTTDVNSQLATKADAKDVTDALALKDDTADVDKKISNVTNSVNSLSSTVTSNKSATDTALGTKANANDVANSFEEVRNRVKKLEGQQELTAPDFNTLTSTGIYMIENPTNGKNSPSNGNWGTLVVSRGTTGSDSRILQEYYPDSGDLPYFRMSGPGGVWREWKQLSDQSEINSLRDAVNTKADKTALDAYAKSADVANDVKTLQDNINAKADAQTVSDAISKIDLTPFAKTADVNSALSGKADKVTIDAINKALASKRDITDSYSRDELDKKFLQLSADTGGKVSADQVSKLIAGKADQDDVDKKIKAVTDAVNTKANSSDVTSLINSNADKLTQAINAITYSAKERPLPSNDANEITEDGIYRVGGDPLKNGAGQQWSFLLVKKWDENTIFQMIYGGTKGIFIRDISKTGNSYPAWTRANVDADALQNTLNAKANSSDVNTALAKKDDITDVDAKIKTVTDLANTKADASDTYNKKAVDDAFSQRDSNLTALQNNLQGQIDKQVNSTWAIDNNSGKFNAVKVDASGNSTQSFTQPGLDLLNSRATEIDQLKGRQNVDAPDFNNLTDTGVYYVSDSKYKGMTNGPNNNWGVLVVSNGSNNRISQVYYPDDGNPPWYRSLDESTWRPWYQLSTRNDVSNANNAANAASSKVDTVLSNSYFRKQGMNENGDLVEIRGNAAKQANGGYSFDIWSSDWTASKLKDVLGQLPSKANTSDVNNALNGKANTDDMTTLQNKVNVNTPLFREISADSTWEDIFGVTNPNNVLTSLRINPGGSGQLVNDFAAGIGFGGNDTKAVITVDYGSHVARFTAGNGTSPGWSEDVAWKSDINSLNSTISALQQTVQSLQNTVNQQATQITGLQTLVNNQANEIKQLQETTIKGKTFSKSQEAAAEAWESQNSQQIAFIRDKQ